MASTTALAPRPLTLDGVLKIKQRGGQITYNLDGERVITYPQWAVDARTLELFNEMYKRRGQ